MGMGKGKLIVFEGGEGSGKTSALEYVAARLTDAMSTATEPASLAGVVATREPGGTPFAEAIRDLALSPDARDMDGIAQLLLMFASRRTHIEELIRPSLTEGAVVLCDRFVASSWAYNICGQEQREHEHLFRSLEDAIVKDIDISYLYFSVPVRVGIQRRAAARGTPNHFDERKIAFHERVQKGYQEYLEDKGHTVIDATQPLDDVCEEALAAVRAATS